MKYDYDLISIGLGPAGMAVSIMGSEMGLKVCAIEKHKIGGECMNCGCIPSKALLRSADSAQLSVTGQTGIVSSFSTGCTTAIPEDTTRSANHK